MSYINTARQETCLAALPIQPRDWHISTNGGQPTKKGSKVQRTRRWILEVDNLMPSMLEEHADTHKLAAVDQCLKEVPNGEGCTVCNRKRESRHRSLIPQELEALQPGSVTATDTLDKDCHMHAPT